MTIGAIHLHFLREHPDFRLEYNVSQFINCTFEKKLKEYDQQRYFQKTTCSLNAA